MLTVGNKTLEFELENNNIHYIFFSTLCICIYVMLTIGNITLELELELCAKVLFCFHIFTSSL